MFALNNQSNKLKKFYCYLFKSKKQCKSNRKMFKRDCYSFQNFKK